MRADAARVLRSLSRLIAREPVRVRLYGVLTAIVGLLVARGLLTGLEAPLWLALAAAALGVGGVESARAHVTPWPPAEASQRE